MAERLTKAQAAAVIAEADFDIAQDDLVRWQGYSRWLAVLMAAMLIVDAILLPLLVRATNAREAADRASATPAAVPPDVPAIGTGEDPTLGMHTRLTDAIEASTCGLASSSPIGP